MLSHPANLKKRNIRMKEIARSENNQHIFGRNLVIVTIKSEKAYHFSELPKAVLIYDF